MTRRVLTIEDDAAIRRGICDALRFAGYQAIEAGDGVAGRNLALRAEYDVLLLDLVLPGRDGLEILAELRRLRPTVPVIILTALGEEADRVRGLREGADDYVVKPFSVKELLARVEALIRRSPQRARVLSDVAIPGGHVCLDRCEACFDDGGREELSEREVDLLRYLAGNPSRAVTRTNPGVVEQILFNLVDNACKYARAAEDRRIHLAAQLGRGQLDLSVRDHGPGIAAGVARRLFRPFCKSARDAAESAPGVGIGLALSRRLARQLGGELSLVSADCGGAAFVLGLRKE